MQPLLNPEIGTTANDFRRAVDMAATIADIVQEVYERVAVEAFGQE